MSSSSSLRSKKGKICRFGESKETRSLMFRSERFNFFILCEYKGVENCFSASLNARGALFNGKEKEYKRLFAFEMIHRR